MKMVNEKDKTMTDPPFAYGCERLSIDACLALSTGKRKGILSPKGREKIRQSRGHVQQVLDTDKVVYGVNTGLGPLCRTRISPEELSSLQHNLLKSHSVGVGAPLSLETVRQMLVIKIHTLSLGFSGIAEATIERMLWHLEKGYIPRVPAQGSVGASGDLAPLAHLFLPLIGEGALWNGTRYVPTQEVLQKEGRAALRLEPKEGLALINGTQLISAYAVGALWRFFLCLEAADMAGAMSLEGFRGSRRPFDERLHRTRPFEGSMWVAARLRDLLKDSTLSTSSEDYERVQDPYSFRCMPQVHGASRHAWLHLKTQTEQEINSATDNPIVIDEQTILSGGNFHGQLLALPLDYVTLAAAELGNISERRVYVLMQGDGEALPKLLVKDVGIHSGLMLPQYTAAALVSENKVLSHPASVDSIPTGLGQEDHVSMGPAAGRKLQQVLGHLEYILGIELFYAAQALECRRPLRASPLIEACHALLRTRIAPAGKDRVYAPDLEAAAELIRTTKLQQTLMQEAHLRGIDLDKERLFSLEV